MPLEAYKRGNIWWAKGRVEFNGRAISSYIRESTGASARAGAEDWIRERTETELRRYHFGEELLPLTLAEAALFAELDPQAANYMIPVVEKFGDMRMNEMTPDAIKAICRTVRPDASTDTWKRWIVVPLQRIARAGHAKGRCAPILFPGFKPEDRLSQDRKRGKKSRQKKTPGSRAWLEDFKTTAPPQLYILARFMFETATRIGQAIAMTPAHFRRKHSDYSCG